VVSRLICMVVAAVFFVSHHTLIFAKDDTQHPIGIDDILALEGVGKVMMLPGGSVVYEYIPPIVQRTQFGSDEGRTNAVIMILDRNSESPRTLIPPEPGSGYLLASRSPSGHRLFVFKSSQSSLSGFALDVDTGVQHALAELPYADIWEKGRDGVTWISDHEVLFSIAPDEFPNLLPGVRVVAAQKQAERWRRAFTGGLTADVLRSSPNYQRPDPVNGRLMRWNIETGEIAQEADGLHMDLAISPDGVNAASLRRLRLIEAYPADKEARRDARFGEQLSILNLDQKQQPAITPCPDCQVQRNSLRWSPNGQFLSFFARPFGEQWRKGRHFKFDVKGNHLTEYSIPEAAFGPWAIEDDAPYVAAPLGRALAVPIEAGSDFHWVAVDDSGTRKQLTSGLSKVSPNLIGSDASGIVILADGDLWRVSYSGSRRNLTPGIPPIDTILPSGSAGTPGVDPAIDASRGPNVVIAHTNARGKGSYAFNLLTGSSSFLGTLGPFDRVVATSISGQQAVVVNSSRAGLALYLLGDRKARRPFSVLNDNLAKVAWPSKDRLDFRLDGNDLVACIYAPADTAVAKNAPTIVWLYPDFNLKKCDSNSVRLDTWEWGVINGGPDLYSPAYLASLGYNVLVPATPKGVVNTEKEALAHIGRLVEVALDTAISQGKLSDGKVGLFGMSQGGFTALKALTQSKRFDAAIASFSIADYASAYGDTGLIRSTLSSLMFGDGLAHWFRGNALDARSSPWENPDWFVNSSPYIQSSKITTPVLLVQADLDASFEMSQFNMMFTSLYMQHADAEYVRYWGEGHGVSSPANIRDLDSRIRSWFLTRLGPDSGSIDN
jgi:dipeptidyl aminopeptidase/acylaminoacyl peptidase